MSLKTLIWIWIAIGSTVGGMIPALWGEGVFSVSALVFSSIGAFVGIYIGFKMGQ